MSDLEQQAASWVPPWQRPAGPSTPDASPDATLDAPDDIDEEIPTEEPWCEVDDPDPDDADAEFADLDDDAEPAGLDDPAGPDGIRDAPGADAGIARADVAGVEATPVSGVVSGLPRQAGSSSQPVADLSGQAAATPIAGESKATVAAEGDSSAPDPDGGSGKAAEAVGGQAQAMETAASEADADLTADADLPGDEGAGLRAADVAKPVDGAAKKGRGGRLAKAVVDAPLPESVVVPGQRESDESTVDSPPLPEIAPGELAPTLEAILMVVDEPASEIMLSQVLDVPAEDIASALIELSASYTREGRGFDLRRAAGGWRFYTRADYSSYVERFVLDGQQLRLTQASLETLAVVAYRQPVTRSRISAIRGVNCDGVIRTLVTRGMVEECGTDPDSGAHLYRTTSLFLEKLGLDSVEQLPPIAPFLPDNLDEMEAV